MDGKYNKHKQEVIYANHVREFSRFYKRHKDLCNEMSGIKSFYFQDIEITIEKNNFDLAIKRLSAYIIDNLHYISEKDKRDYLIFEIRKLENEIINDENFQYYSSKDNLNTDDLIIFNKLYFVYLKRSFELAYVVSKSLEKSLMITTRDVRKNIEYYDFQEFYESLARYRDEVSNTISNFKFKDVLINLKQILSYHYTYKIFMLSEDSEQIDVWSNDLYEYLLSDDSINLIIKANNGKYTREESLQIRKETLLIRDVLGKIYVKTNEALSERNILPKVNKKIYIDTTLV